MTDMHDDSNSPIERLLRIMARLRDPDGGCPWDLEQSFLTIAPHTIEEAYEVADAIQSGDMEALKDELGDLLFQVVFYAQMAREEGHFDFDDIARAISNKMIGRHPHVFGSEDIDSAAAQTKAWEVRKAEERAAKAAKAGMSLSTLDGVARGLPALTRAVKLQNRAARVGFDWPGPLPVLDKIAEELEELVDEMVEKSPQERLIEEFGDLMFVQANLARHLKIDPEAALRDANAKFERRFRRIEEMLAEAGKTPEDSDLEEMDALWNRVKAEERGDID